MRGDGNDEKTFYYINFSSYFIGSGRICFVVREINPRIGYVDEDEGYQAWSEVDYLMDEVDGKYYFFGDKLTFPQKMELEYISKIDTASLDMNHDWVYLIINDWKEEQDITEETVKELVEFANQNSKFSFIYIGNKAFDYFRKELPGFQPIHTDLGFGYEMRSGNRIVSLGVFTNNDLRYLTVNKYIPADGIISSMESHIRSN